MRATVVVLSVLVAAASVGAMVVSTASNGNTELLDEIIYTANQDNLKNHKDKVQVPDWSHDGLLLKVSLKNGQAMNFSTLALRGQDQVFEQTDFDNYSRINFTLNVGLEEIQAEFDYTYSFLYVLGSSGRVSLSNNRNTVQAKGFIITRDDGSCDAILESAVLQDIGDFNIQITPSSLSKSILRSFVSFVANYIVPHTKFVINSVIKSIVENQVPKSDFSKMVCKPLVI